MTPIVVGTLINAKATKFGASALSADFTQLCIDAINYCISDLNERLYTTTPPITGVADQIQIDAQTFQNVISMGMDYYISNDGRWTIQNLQNVDAKYQDKLKTVQMNHQKTLHLHYKFGNLRRHHFPRGVIFNAP